MVDLVADFARLFGAFVLVALNGFFVAAEFAYVRVRSSAVERAVAEGKTGATLLQEAVDNLDDYLATTQLGITIASLGLGWLGEPAVAALLEPVLAPVLPESLLHLVSFAIGFSFITFLHVVFGELAPKTISIAQAERVALLVSPLMKFFYYIFVPGIVVFNGTANAFTRLIGIPPASETDETLSEEEIRTVLSRSGSEGQIDAEEVEMIEQVFELDDTTVQQVMVPRPDAVTIASDRSLSDLRSLILEEGHTRYPVLDSDGDDQVVGFVDAKDVLRAGESEGDLESVTVGEVTREMPVVPETTRVTELLEQFQGDRAQMAAVIDEWGVFEGIVTVEDVIEVVVGDLRDGFDADEPSIDRRDDGAYVVDGGVTVSDVNERLDADFESDEFGTIGGLVLDRLGRAPEVGDHVEVDGYALEVSDVEGARIASLIVRENPRAEESTD
ncbi:HlyC/CorC family transporter [Haloterrigena sp. SYSU A558-1]|uniref:HlyC/CorC family transporter n=1 Tax=Haloterrigena gelatinilytica TaxID=2741724 RepID=A0A8J8KF19_9EURY|nr:hemolysin family protein [Haloterrigena gelatinilytica]NUB91858.1 HlyC/CorC family transporter [Haloterrigena gelatinilytica]NUC72317.1 HlyC/CorC family transporter [Haloterrigena gelatinilytica]